MDTPATADSAATPRKFSTKRKEVVVEIDDQLYTVREMTGTQLDAWRTQMGNRITTDAKGNPRVGNFDRLTASLLVLCLFKPDGSAVGLPEVSSWPASLQKELFDICQDLNGLSVAGEDAAKKD
jgi:hypothetical protein